jgi:RHS repeat-associated protein
MKFIDMKKIHFASLAFALAWIGSATAGNPVCVEYGGKMGCSPPVILSNPPDKWDFGYCREVYLVNNAVIWCQRLQGTWDINIPGCVNPQVEITEENFDQNAKAVEMQFHGACDVASEALGWGATITSSNCETGSTVQIGPHIAKMFNRVTYFPTYDDGSGHGCTTPSGTPSYLLTKSRDVGCAEGKTLIGSGPDAVCTFPLPPEDQPEDDGPNDRDKNDDDKEDHDDDQNNNDEGSDPDRKSCDAPLESNSPESDNVGNPVVVSIGAKKQMEPDYRSTAVGGLHFNRFYNSTGRFSLDGQGEPSSEDYWRHTFSGRVIAFPDGNQYVMAALQEAAGFVKYFAPDGREIHNQSAGKSYLERLTSGTTLTGWRLTNRHGSVRVYDPQGRLSSITTRKGLVYTLTYNTAGKLEAVTNPFGRAITLAYSNGRLSTMTDPAGRVTQYGYDASGRLSTVTRPDSSVRTYVYEDGNWPWALTGILDERGTRLSTFTYEAASGRVSSTQRSGPENRYTIQYTYGPNGGSSTATDAFGVSHIFNYDWSSGVAKMSSRSSSALGSKSASYNANGTMATKTNRRGHVTNYSWDATRNLRTSKTFASNSATPRTVSRTWHPTFNLPVQVVRPSGVPGVDLVTESTYNAAGALTKLKMSAGSLVREWNYTVNSIGQILTIDGPRTDVSDITTITYFPANDSCLPCRGQVSTITNALGHVTTISSYNGDGHPLSVTDANGIVTTLDYSSRGWLDSITTAGETYQYQHDVAGNVTRVTRPDGSWINYTYNAANRLTGVDDSIGNAADFQLDAKGNAVVTNLFDPQDHVALNSQRVFDNGNRLAREVGSQGQATAYQRDPNGNVTLVTDPLLRETRTFYDAFNRPTSMIDAANGTVSFGYDANDRLTSLTDPRSLTTAYAFDGLGNLTSVSSPDTGSTTYTHNAAGQIQSRTDARGVTTTYTTDALGRVTAASVADGTVSYEFDNTTTGGPYARGRITKITDPSGSTSYVWDAQGRVSTKTSVIGSGAAQRSFTTSYGYSLGRPSSITLPSGRVVALGFNAQGQVASVAIDGTTLLSGGEYFPFGGVKKWTWANGQVYERGFDLDGRVSSATIGPNTQTYPDLSQVFGYDALNRLVSAALAAGQSRGFGYDANGNRTSATINGASTTYTYPSSSHRLSSLSGANAKSFTYDAAGNTSQSGALTFSYDGRGRMKQAGALSYLVNGLGQRAAKGIGTSLTYFAFDEGGRLIGEYDGTGASIQETVWLEGTPVATIRPKAGGGFDVFYVWADHLDTPRAVSDSLNQSRWTWDHADPFGAHAPNENPAGVGVFAFNLRFPGQYYDAETGTHYNYFRDYDPAIGRYVESDPQGLAAGLNSYSYVTANPLGDFDFFGLEPDGHHWVIGPIRNDPSLSPEARGIFQDAKTGYFGERHGWDKEHAMYNRGVQDLWDKNKYDPAKMTREQAEDFVRQVRESNDPRVSSYRMKIYNKCIKYAFKRSGIRGTD